MLKLIFCLTRRESMTREEFQDYWRDEHAPKVRAAREALGIRRYVQSHSVPTGFTAAVQEARGIPAEEYDGVAELWFDSEAALAEAMATDEGQRHGAILAEDEARFIDFGRSRLYFAEEFEVIGNG